MLQPFRGILRQRLCAGPTKFRYNNITHHHHRTRSIIPQIGIARVVCFSSSGVVRNGNSLFDHATVSCLPGLEPVLSTELRMLGIPHHIPPPLSRRKKNTGEIKLHKVCTTNDLFRCCLYLGTATQVHWRCKLFASRGLPELKRKIASLPWSEILKPDSIKNGHLDVRVVSSKSKLYHTGAIRDRVLQGIDQHFGNEEDYYHQEERQQRCAETTVPTVLLNVNVLRDEVQLSLNAYPTPLHQRGYREQVAKAPLREDLAFAMLLMGGWTPAWSLDDDKKTTGDEEWQGLMDPFCGSGTIAIEGAAMMLGLPPGRLRHSSPFAGTVLEDTNKWSKLIRKSFAKAEYLKQFDKTSVSILASDRDAGAVEATTANADRAGVRQALTIQRGALFGQRWFETPAESPSSLLVVTNPPFGKRISSSHNNSSSSKGSLPLYQSLGHFLERLSRKHGRKACGVVLTSNPALVTKSGLSIPFKTSFKTYHGGLKVSAMKFDTSNLS